ncbi:MAG TPA: hypothetical protein EYQ54_08240, partial [Myxococcales bacterium]|nr:hypothetical protein [Myxococcales bacterium]
MIAVSVQAWSAWSPGIEGEEAWRQWACDPKPLERDGSPKVNFVPAMLRRRCDQLSRMMLYVTNESAEATGAMFALNPFSGPALIAMVLAIINLVWVATKFKETLPSANRGNTPNTRSLNPFKRLSSLKFPGVVRINFIYLLYLVA